MKILDQLFNPQIANLEKALDRTTLRHSLLSGNLANVNTPGYKRKDVDFGIVLEGELSGHQFKLRGPGSRANDGAVIRQDGSSVDLESEVMGMAETELRYQALTDMTARYFANLKGVIRDAK